MELLWKTEIGRFSDFAVIALKNDHGIVVLALFFQFGDQFGHEIHTNQSLFMPGCIDASSFTVPVNIEGTVRQKDMAEYILSTVRSRVFLFDYASD